MNVARKFLNAFYAKLMVCTMKTTVSENKTLQAVQKGQIWYGDLFLLSMSRKGRPQI